MQTHQVNAWCNEACVVFGPLRTGDTASLNNFAVASAARGDFPAGFANLEDAFRIRPDYYYAARYNISPPSTTASPSASPAALSRRSRANDVSHHDEYGSNNDDWEDVADDPRSLG
ncbi:MAG: hypothetical protein HY646_17060, partial [Acidobacteria bacterium]|nr:hypothetical protein [Acidobacteriota bacterium]